MEEYKALEVQLREQLVTLETSKIEEVTKLTAELVEKDRKLDSDVTSYKEQIKQHSVTICAMEERISKVMKKNKECMEEAEAYRKQIQGKIFVRYSPSELCIYRIIGWWRGWKSLSGKTEEFIR